MKKGNKKIDVTPMQIMAWQLRRAGHTIAQTAAMLNCSVNSVTRWSEDVDHKLYDELSKMPDVQTAIDSIKLLIPDAVNTYRKLVNFADNDSVRLKAADRILSNFKVIIEEQSPGDDKSKPDTDLASELVSIIKSVVERDKPVAADNPRTEKT